MIIPKVFRASIAPLPCENHARKMRTFFTCRLEPNVSHKVCSVVKHSTQTQLKSLNKLQLNSSPVFSKTKLGSTKAKHGAVQESKLTLHAAVIFWVKTNKTKKTPSQHSLTTITRENYTSRTYFSQSKLISSQTKKHPRGSQLRYDLLIS